MADQSKTTPAAKRLHYIFISGPSMQTWELVGTQEANDRDQAIRLQFPDATAGHSGPIVAVSEAGWKPSERVLETRPTAKLNPIPMTGRPQPVTPTRETDD